jgi:hypothetical protein
MGGNLKIALTGVILYACFNKIPYACFLKVTKIIPKNACEIEFGYISTWTNW